MMSVTTSARPTAPQITWRVRRCAGCHAELRVLDDGTRTVYCVDCAEEMHAYEFADLYEDIGGGD
jgi:hypothetical protein